LVTKHAILTSLVSGSSLTKHSSKKLDYWKCVQECHDSYLLQKVNEIIKKVYLAIVKVEKEVKCLGSWDQGNGFVMVDLWNSEEFQLKGGGEEE
jgi:hypothetical protein